MIFPRHLLLLPLLILASCRDEKNSSTPSVKNETPIRIETQRPLMGTLFQVTSHASDPEAGHLAMEAALDLAEEFAQQASDYAPHSELNRLSKSPLHTPVPVSKNLYHCLLLSQKLAQQSHGLFDPTYGPLTHLWRETKRNGIIPSKAQISAARARCGIQHLRFHPATQTITILRADLQLDLGGIAKGYAADLIYDHLIKHGYPQSLVAAAGDLRIGDPPPGRDGWNIGLRSFRLTPTSSLSLKNCAVSTSGDLFQNITANGQKYSHLIDPKTGLGLTARRSASVILPHAKLTDPLATIACLSDHPESILDHYPKASIRVLSQDPNIPPITTGLFSN